MYAQFARTLSRLRHEKGVSQRQAAQELGVSQALLSHYENGIREPGLAFVVRACDYYQVSADYLLGRQSISGEGQTTPLPAPEEAAADLLAEALPGAVPPQPRQPGHPQPLGRGTGPGSRRETRRPTQKIQGCESLRRT